MGRLRAASLLLAAIAACLALASCGSGDSNELLPGTTAGQIESNLELVRESSAAGNCEEAETTVAEISEEIDALQRVDAKLKAALEEGATRLSEVGSSCKAGAEAAEQKEAEEDQADEEEQAQAESEEEAEAEEEMLEKAQKDEEREEKAEEKAEAEKEAEQPGPAEGKGSGPKEEEGPGEAEEVEPPSEEVTPPVEEGSAGGIGPGSAVEGGP